jgi:hypothetical protein
MRTKLVAIVASVLLAVGIASAVAQASPDKAGTKDSSPDIVKAQNGAQTSGTQATFKDDSRDAGKNDLSLDQSSGTKADESSGSVDRSGSSDMSSNDRSSSNDKSSSNDNGSQTGDHGGQYESGD